MRRLLSAFSVLALLLAVGAAIHFRGRFVTPLRNVQPAAVAETRPVAAAAVEPAVVEQRSAPPLVLPAMAPSGPVSPSMSSPETGPPEERRSVTVATKAFRLPDPPARKGAALLNAPDIALAAGDPVQSAFPLPTGNVNPPRFAPPAPAVPQPALRPPPRQLPAATEPRPIREVHANDPAGYRKLIYEEVLIQVHVHIDEAGRVVRAVFDPPKGPYARYFAGQAVVAARTWRFEPARQGALPVQSDAVLRFRFQPVH